MIKFNSEVHKLIRQRYSCRSYDPTPLSVRDLVALQEAASHTRIGPFNNHIQLEIISASPENNDELKRLGTYGFIKNPTGFIILAAPDLPGSMEDVGYLAEILILKATDLGIGTCWLGGTFTRSEFARSIDLKDGHTIPAVISIGYPLDKQALMDRISRIYAGSDRRLSWPELFFQNTFDHPLPKSEAGHYQEPLELVRLAPSASNKQPWRVVQVENRYHFYLQRTKNYPGSFFNKILDLADLQRIDLGIAMAHFELSLPELELEGAWIKADPGLSLPNTGKDYIISWQPSS